MFFFSCTSPSSWRAARTRESNVPLLGYEHVPFRLVTCELYTLSFVQLASAQMSQSKLCLGSFALCFCGEQLMMHMSMRQHELVLGIVRLKTILSPLYGLMVRAFGVALVFKPEGQYFICPLSHGGASPSASPKNHRRTGTLICHGRVKDVFCNIAWSCHKGPSLV